MKSVGSGQSSVASLQSPVFSRQSAIGSWQLAVGSRILVSVEIYLPKQQWKTVVSRLPTHDSRLTIFSVEFPLAASIAHCLLPIAEHRLTIPAFGYL
jgi:hypothetical protein